MSESPRWAERLAIGLAAGLVVCILALALTVSAAACVALWRALA